MHWLVTHVCTNSFFWRLCKVVRNLIISSTPACLVSSWDTTLTRQQVLIWELSTQKRSLQIGQSKCVLLGDWKISWSGNVKAIIHHHLVLFNKTPFLFSEEYEWDDMYIRGTIIVSDNHSIGIVFQQRILSKINISTAKKLFQLLQKWPHSQMSEVTR